ncbi:CIC11C00000000179 [Sungouiella intermedia]|uniref:CIC11C00000000179 n=1 Tax=Sungouiella intermedia TaxID=45354 RepID=A0A1L0C1I3_9ASCO|nr:CIC11C00000000179 [[Candida] intermedia]
MIVSTALRFGINRQLERIPAVKVDNLAKEIQTLLDTIEYLAEVSATQRELHNDAEGLLTHFIAAMPEEEEAMSIREWIDHNATTCGRTVREISERVIRTYEEAFDKVIDQVAQMDTVD